MNRSCKSLLMFFNFRKGEEEKNEIVVFGTTTDGERVVTKFCQLIIRRIEEFTFESIPLGVAKVENLNNALELQTVLKQFYPTITATDKVYVFHFEFVDGRHQQKSHWDR